MKKTLRFLLVSLAILLVVTGCNNEAPEEDDIEDDNIEALADDETTDDEGESDGESDQSAADEASNGEVLSLGETGVMMTNLGDYEVTPTAFRYASEMGEDDPKKEPSSDTFVIIDFTITNIGDEIIDTESIVFASILEVTGQGGDSAYEGFESIDNFADEIDTDETVEGQMIFDSALSEEYELSFGSAYIDSMSNTERWILYGDEVEN
ncbi:DUF4352 domain-containing protein [Amphibacillus sp. Q70]|uniref:DUF4352 domain-containing protein n=1 Tax=Amphibacillus sp. Q70 TaxID=3453416 RepID=UPI003F872510